MPTFYQLLRGLQHVVVEEKSRPALIHGVRLVDEERAPPARSLVSLSTRVRLTLRSKFIRKFLHIICWPNKNSSLSTQIRRPIRAPLLVADFRRDRPGPVTESGDGGGTGWEPRVGAHREMPWACTGTRNERQDEENPGPWGRTRTHKIERNESRQKVDPPPDLTTHRLLCP